MNVYFISGLGADKRAFRYIQLDDRLSIIHLDWLKVQQNESLKSYAKRMGDCIDVSQPFCVVGLSFGGIVANEISNILAPEKIVLISTAKSRNELPLLFRVSGALNLHKLLPLKFMLKQRKITHRFFGAKSDAEKVLLNEILYDSDPNFISWAIDKIVNWDNMVVPKEYLHLHGDNDIIFPVKGCMNCKTIKGGTHLMILKKHRTISDAINHYLLNKE